MDGKIFFHIGLSKTGTKFFQDKVFPYLEGVKYIPKRRYYRIFEILQNIDYQKVLTSQELDRQFDTEIEKWARKYPETQIIMVLRRQDSWFVSQYKRFIKNGFTGSFEEFIDIRKDKGYFKIKDGLYFPKIQKILNSFQNKPLILNYDDLKNKPELFTKKILDFLGVNLKKQLNFKPKHVSYSEKQLKTVLKYGKKFGIKLRKYDDENRFKRFFQRLEQMTKRYFVLYVVNFFVKEDSSFPLIPQQNIEAVREFYKEDWEKCLKYFEKI